MARKTNGDYEVGYGKPPVHTQFQKGTSGHAGGKRKRPKTYAEEVAEVMRSSMTVTENGEKKTMTRARALALQNYLHAFKGDHRVTMDLIKTFREQEALEAEADAKNANDNLPPCDYSALKHMPDEDIETLKKICKRLDENMKSKRTFQRPVSNVIPPLVKPTKRGDNE